MTPVLFQWDQNAESRRRITFIEILREQEEKFVTRCHIFLMERKEDEDEEEEGKREEEEEKVF